MSLIHWWPLNGNITDNGVDNFTLSATPSFSAAGKIGKCATNTNISAGLTYLSNQTLPLAKDSPISIFTWVYMNDYSTTGANLNGLVSNHNHGHNGDKGSGFGLNLRNNGNSFQVSISTSSTGGRTFSTYCGNTTFSAGEWHHVGFTYNGSRINFYLDGNYDGGLNFTSSYNSNNPIGIFCWSTGYPEYSSSCQLNDVRIYNHALSAKEVKEISKGLVLHYNFEDEYIEPTTNLFGGRTDFSNTNHWSRSQINSTAPTIDTDGNMVLYGAGTDGNHQSYTVSSSGGYITISPSTTYTLSVYIKYSSTNAYFNMYFYERTDSAAVKTNVQRLGCTADEVGKWVLRKLTVTTQSTTTKMYTELNCYKCLATETIVMKNNTVQLEAKDHATPYVNGIRSTGKVYDNSGYGNNGTVAGSPQIDSTTSSGQHSIYFPTSNAYIKLPVLNYSGFANSYTFSWWAKKTDLKDSMAWGFADGNRLNLYPTGSVICWNTGDGSSNQFKSNGSSIKYSQWNNNWHLFTVTGNGTVTKLYVDGQEAGTATTYKALTGTQIYISGWDASVNYKWIGNIGDFKIYSTALSADDIKAEYNRKAAIDKNSNLFTGEIIETSYNLLTSENLLNGRVNTSATSNVGEIVTRNGYSAYRLSPVAYWSGNEATSKNICKGQFGSGQYIFDLWIDVDGVYYDGEDRWVPGGFVVYYTDGSVDNVVVDANSTQGHSGYQHLIRKTNSNKTISGLGVYYYIGVPVYIRCDSVICKVNSDGKICKNNIIAGGQFVEPAVSDSKCKLTRYGVVSNAIKEL